MAGMEPESAEDFYARVQAATGPDGRLAVAVEEMPGWDIYPFEIDSLRMKPLQPLADEEPPRGGENPAECCCARPPDPGRGRAAGLEQRALAAPPRLGDEAADRPQPRPARALRPADGPRPPRRRDGQLIVAVSAAVESLPSVGRVQLAKYGDGGAHLHLFFLGPPGPDAPAPRLTPPRLGGEPPSGPARGAPGPTRSSSRSACWPSVGGTGPGLALSYTRGLVRRAVTGRG